MKEEQIKKAYELAKARYAEFGIDTDKAIETLERTPISLTRPGCCRWTHRGRRCC